MAKDLKYIDMPTTTKELQKLLLTYPDYNTYYHFLRRHYDVNSYPELTNTDKDLTDQFHDRYGKYVRETLSELCHLDSEAWYEEGKERIKYKGKIVSMDSRIDDCFYVCDIKYEDE